MFATLLLHIALCGLASKPPAAVVEETESVESIDEVQLSKPSDSYFSEAYPQFDRVLDHYTARCVRFHHFATLISHRNSEPAFLHPARDLLGFDGGGLKIDLGLRFGILSWLDTGLVRQNGTVELFDTYEFDLRFQLLNQAQHGIDVALRPGLSWFNEIKKNSVGFFGEVILSRVLFHRWMLAAGVIFHSYSSGPNKSGSDNAMSTAVFVSQEIRILGNFSMATEVTPNIAGYHDAYPVFTFGPKYITNRHTFSAVFSNSQYMTTDSIITNTYRLAPTTWVFGFHITREL